MTHLRIEQSTSGNEYVTSDIIHKLYETAKGILDEEALNEVEESQVSLQGSLVVPKAYGDEIDWLETKFPDLHITAGVRYIRFADDAVYARLSLYLGDGTGITSSDITNANIFSSSNDSSTGYPYFRGNTSITSFNELGLLPLVTTLPGSAFRDTSNLTSIDLSNLTSVGDSSFWSSGITSADLSSCTTINNSAFRLCTDLTTVILNSSISTISNWAFSGCTSLILIDLSNVTNVLNSAFENCTSLTNVDLSSCTNIGQSVFLNCTSLTSVDVSNVLSGSLSSTFEGCTSLTSVTLPSTSFIWGSNVNNHKSVFLGCTSLTSIDMSNATFIGLLYFQGCTALTTCIWPTSITTIPTNCFTGCTNLESLGSKISPTQINNSAFKDCNKLTLDDIDLSSIITIETRAFENSGISGVVNLTNCTYIGENAFNGCAVTEIHGPNVTSISSWSIYSLPTLLVLDLPVCSRCPSCPRATSLTTLNVPSATSFGLRGDLSLSDCRNLTTLNIPFENFIGVMDYAFLNCVGLSGQTFDFGTGLQYIGIEAFTNTSINIVLRNTSVVPAVDRTFESYSGLIYVPDELVETYKTSTGYSSVSSQIKGISELPST